jgi:hypothetical protein
MDMYYIGQSVPVQMFRYTPDPEKNFRSSVAFLQRGQYVLCGSPTGSVGIWETSSGQHQQTLEHHGQFNVFYSLLSLHDLQETW